MKLWKVQPKNNYLLYRSRVVAALTREEAKEKGVELWKQWYQVSASDLSASPLPNGPLAEYLVRNELRSRGCVDSLVVIEGFVSPALMDAFLKSDPSAQNEEAHPLSQI